MCATIDRVRLEECSWLWKGRALKVMSVTIGRVSPVLAACATFTAMSLLGRPLRAEIVFAALAAFNALRMPLITIPLNLIEFKEMAVSAGRVTKYLTKDEHVAPPNVEGGESESECKEDAEAAAEAEGRTKLVVHLQKAHFKWSTTGFALQNLSLQVRQGDLIGICGKVGTGKSTFLSSPIGETSLTSGTLRVCRDIGFASQKAFILSGTVRDNILMGRPFDPEALHRAMRCSEFLQDLGDIPLGDSTEIGERGVTLSGGQKQRLALARAIYTRPQLLLLDDPLSAVDVKVGKRIFEEVCLGRKAAGLSTIITLNQAQFFSKFDKMIILQEGGAATVGNYESLLAHEEFSAMVRSASSGAHDDFDAIPVSSDEVELSKNETQKAKTNVVEANASDGPEAGKANGKSDSHAAGLIAEDVREVGQLSRKAILSYFKSAGGGYGLLVLCSLARRHTPAWL